MKYAYTAGLSMPMVESRLLLMAMFALPIHTLPEEASVIFAWTRGSRKMRSSGYACFSSSA